MRHPILLLLPLLLTPTTSLPSDFLPTLRDTLSELSTLLSLLSTLSGPDLRSSSAVQDCVDLLDLSVQELTWTADTAQAGPMAATGRPGRDVKAWLSAALGNQDTCAEGFDGTDGVLKGLVVGGLGTVTELVAGVLSQVPVPDAGFGGGSRKLLGNDIVGGFPTWLGPAERRLMQSPAVGMQPDAVVAADGSGDFITVSDAIDAVPVESTKRTVIYVKRGIYKEIVDIKKKKWNVMLVGDGVGATVITGDRNYVDGWTTFRTATFSVSGKGFIARDITFENTAGPAKHQAVALRSDSDLSVFFQCEFNAYQDTLYAHSLRQFYRDCLITGTVDFIFGNAAAVFQSCRILPRKPLPNQKNSVTAHGRKDPNQNTGFSIQYCNITAAADLSLNSTETYLGRPWKEYARTVVMQSYLGEVVHPKGWLEWSGDFALGTLYYGEYMNYGPGSGLGSRVKWPGYHVIGGTTEAGNFTVSQFIDGNAWLPATGVKYTAGLTV